MCQVEGEHELERVRRKKLEDAKRQIEAEADRKLADRYEDIVIHRRKLSPADTTTCNTWR